MAERLTRKARSVADPDGPAYDEMIRRHKAELAAKEAELERRHATAKKAKQTAETFGNVMTAAEVIRAVVATLSGDADDLAAVKAVKRFGGKVGPAASFAAANAGYAAEVARGVPKDEAGIRNYGGFALGTAFGGLASAAGVLAGAPLRRIRGGSALAEGGASILGYMGQRDGEMLADGVADAWAGGKREARGLRTTFNRGIHAINHPIAVGLGRERF